MPNGTCSVDGCERLRRKRDWCEMHYARWRTHGTTSPTAVCVRCGESFPTIGKGRRVRCDGCKDLCLVLGCERQRFGTQPRCSMHEQRIWRNGEVGEVESRRQPGRPHKPTAAGYVTLQRDGRTVKAHRAAMEALIGRALFPFETVHHKNGLRHDNRPENLELWVKPQPYGQRPEDLAAWVVDHYPDLVRESIQQL